jgi:hypothetical protein
MEKFLYDSKFTCKNNSEAQEIFEMPLDEKEG